MPNSWHNEPACMGCSSAPRLRDAKALQQLYFHRIMTTCFDVVHSVCSMVALALALPSTSALCTDRYMCERATLCGPSKRIRMRTPPAF